MTLSAKPSQPWRAEIRATLALAWPLILSNLTLQFIQLTDTLLVGRLGARELAATSLALSLTFAMTLFALGLLTASAPMMATALGVRRSAVRDVRRTFRQALWAAAMMSAPILLVLWFASDIIVALGQDPGLAEIAGRFLRGYMWAVPPWMAYAVMRNFMSALERPRWVLAISAVGIPLNGLLSAALIFGFAGLPALGVFGAGLGSSIVWWAMAGAMAAVLVLDRRFRRFHLFGRWWRADWPRFAKMLRLGAPIGLTMGFEGGVFSAAAYLMGFINAQSVAAHQIALMIAATTFMVPMALGQAATVRVGLMLGRGDRDGIARAGWTAFALGEAFMAAMALMMWLFPATLVGLFLGGGADAPQVAALAADFLLMAALFQLADGAQVLGAGMLRGLHDTRVPMVIALFGYWGIGIGVGVLLAFRLGWGGVGIWAGLASGLAVVALLLLWRWHRRDRLALGRAALAP